MIRMTRIVTLAFLGIAATGLITVAGDLNPPGGAVAPTHKTLTEVEPRTAINPTNTPGDADSLFKITQPGSYYLTGNVAGVLTKHGIEIVASGVTLDLNGFDLVGTVASLDGVSVTVAGLTNIAVVNGSVRSWSDEGVDLATVAATNCRVEGVHASGNAGNGISVGIGCTASNCSAYLNTGNGFSASTGCTVSNCTAYNNTGSGISTNNGCTVSYCAANSNTAGGINTGTGSTVSNCSAASNTPTGINVGNGSTVSNCSAFLNIGNGISVLSGCTVSNCSAASNTGSGISVNTGSTVADCTARLNTLDGIVCASSCVIRGNTCSSNGNTGDGAGIHATSADNRLEGNTCTSADRGIDMDLAGNIIIKNTCSGNTTNWDIVIGNAVAPIVQATTNAAPISGSTYAGSLGSTDPNANFTY